MDQREETRAFNRQLEALLAQAPPVWTVEPAVTRALRAEGKGIFPAPEKLAQAEERTIAGPGGGLTLRILVPPDPVGAYLHLHGGGWTLGAADQQDLGLWALATRASVATVSVDYRLAPEHPFPAGPEDCEAAALWLVDHLREVAGNGARSLAIGGESAGAHLAVTTLLRLRDGHGAAGAYVAADLAYGAYDLSLTPSARRWGERNLVLSTPMIRWFTDLCTPGLDDEGRRDPAVSPLYAELSGLPPALFTVGTLDPLLDDSLFMEARWRAAGNGARLRTWPEAVHGFTLFPTGAAVEASETRADFVAAAVRRA